MKVLVRLGADLVIKSARVRSRFLKQLKRNLVAGFENAGIPCQVDIRWTRIFVEFDEPFAGKACDVLGRTFGISSYSIIEGECSSVLDDIVQAGTALYGSKVKGKTFAVRARRASVPGLRSLDIAVELGAALGVHAAGVDLSKPEFSVHVEARPEGTFFVGTPQEGAKGLPLGSGGRVLCLLSGGFDSAVAAWMAMKRGVAVDFLFCNVAGKAYERSVLQIAKQLCQDWGHGTSPRLHVVDFSAVVEALRNVVKPAYTQVVLKRLFYRAADLVADRLGAERHARDMTALLTGEAVAQVSSQTLANLAAIHPAARRPVLRPLVCMDKDEIIDRSRQIGIFAACSRVREYCQLVPDKPITAARAQAVDDWENRLPELLLQQALQTLVSHKLNNLSDAELVLPYVQVDRVPDGAVLVDTRPKQEYDKWHAEGAIHCEWHELIESFTRFDRAQVYVVCCPVGLQSTVVAEKMQTAGFQAYSLKGGVESLRQRNEPDIPLVH